VALAGIGHGARGSKTETRNVTRQRRWVFWLGGARRPRGVFKPDCRWGKPS
jgi:hypothetical protein